MNSSVFMSIIFIAIVIAQRNKKKKLFRYFIRRKSKDRLPMDISLLKNLSGRTVRIYFISIDTMSSSETGLIKSVNEDWVLLENKKGKDVLISNDKIIKINTK
ncbi:MAG TPA: hypothetical protein ENL10_02925 [Candidatus Cloacimonetes bacterium]|nr:hypothetical protein [Candidatus Cloacimonadota bacterium]HHE40437.1 hypothetical protein [Candidatus Cloacimonadota bacterium]